MPMQNKYQIPGYDLIEPLRDGAFGQVFLMREKSKLAMPRAVKVLNPHPFNEKKYCEERFDREAKSIAKLKHSCIVGYVASGYTEDSSHAPYIVMDYVQGDDILTCLSYHPYFERVQLFVRVLDAIHYAHINEVLHRDLKPSNILVRQSDMTPVVVDFGLAYLFEVDGAKALTLSSLGTPGYIPQEVIANPRDRRVAHDIYSCGIILYQILSGKLPDIQIYSPLTEVSSELVGLDRIIKKAIAPVNDRYQNMLAFKTDVENWIKISKERESVPIIKTDFRDRLLNIKKNNDEQRRERELQQLRLKEAMQEAHRLVCVASEAAFRQVGIDLKEVFGSYDFVQLSNDLFPDLDKSPIDLFAIEYKHVKINRRVVISAVRIERQGGELSDPRQLINWHDVNRVSNRRYLPIGWIISQTGNSQTPKRFNLAVMFGLLQEVKEDNLGYSLYGQRKFSIPFKNYPSLFKGAKEIQSFILNILESHFARD